MPGFRLLKPGIKLAFFLFFFEKSPTYAFKIPDQLSFIFQFFNSSKPVFLPFPDPIVFSCVGPTGFFLFWIPYGLSAGIRNADQIDPGHCRRDALYPKNPHLDRIRPIPWNGVSVPLFPWPEVLL